MALLELITRPLIRNIPFRGSAAYWQWRYLLGGHSGRGSGGATARLKADTINSFVSRHNIRTVIEFGCGDGQQLALADYPEYMGFDISSAAVRRCRKRFTGDPSKAFRLMSEYEGETADLVLSLQVILHLVEDDVFDAYMRRLFAASERFVLIHGRDEDAPSRQPHVRFRRFTDWINDNAPGFTACAEDMPEHFHVYQRHAAATPAASVSGPLRPTV